MSVTRKLRPETAPQIVLTFQEVLDLPLSQTGLSIRTVNTFENKGQYRVRDILALTPQEILKIPNFGRKTLAQIYEVLGNLHPDLRRNRAADAA